MQVETLSTSRKSGVFLTLYVSACLSPRITRAIDTHHDWPLRLARGLVQRLSPRQLRDRGM